MFFSFGLLALTQLPSDYTARSAKSGSIYPFTALYSFMAAWQQTQNSETKNGGVGVEHRGVCNCVWNVRNKPKILKRKMVEWASSIVVCVWNVRNKPKIRKQKSCKSFEA